MMRDEGDDSGGVVVVSGGSWTWFRCVSDVVSVYGNVWKKGITLNKRDVAWLVVVAALFVTWLVFVAPHTPTPFSLEIVGGV
jgi:hypothetical protein